MRPFTNTPEDGKKPCQVTVQKGKLFLVEEGNFILLNTPIILKTGIIVNTEGIMNMPDGTTRMLREGEYV
jgi:hypothetical protein